MSDERPDPEALLRRVTADEGRRRGRLKVFFGASPGVGKTYAMLEAARAKRAEGTDVVLGWVETHGRRETAALVEGLERLPPRMVEYKGVTLHEFDLDAALGRKPGLLLIDELAHSNAPGLRHAKRWQDVEELLLAGFDVYTTLNVQHLESLNDLVNRVTGVAVRETVPDRILDRADALEFVDLPPDDLLKRLSDGKVYVGEMAERAVRHFFRRGNLLALRELALRRTAEHVDADVQDYRKDHEIAPTWPVAERILVCVRPNPESDRMVRAARRMAARLKAEWIVATVESPAQPSPTAAERSALAATVRLAEDLGAQTVTLTGPSVAEAVLAFARERNVSRIVVGKPVHSPWYDRLRGSLVDEIVRGSGGIEVMVVPGGGPSPASTRSSLRPGPGPKSAYALAAGVVTACTLVCAPLHGRVDKSNLVMIYLLGVAVVAARHGRRPSAFAAVLSVAAFDFFFVPPSLTFAVSDSQYLITFSVMLVVSLLISTLGARLRAHADAAVRREKRTQVLYGVSRDLAAARSAIDVAHAVGRRLTEILQGPAQAFLPGPDGRLRPIEGESAQDPAESAVGQWAFDHGRPAGLGTDTLPGASALHHPILGTKGALGVLRVRPADSLLPLGPDPLELLDAVARQTASSLERIRLADEAEASRLAAETERLRSTLLSSVSHDLRTPLATITGAASTLLQPTPLAAEEAHDLAESIYEEGERLNRLVTNLLDMTRLESGSLRVHRDWQSIEELVGTAIARQAKAFESRPLTVSVAPDLPAVRVDGLLVEQVLVNLLDNALKYTPRGSPVRVEARASDGEVLVEVADEGPGLLPGTEERVFEKFYRGETETRGAGLGLPICKAVIEAHGGRIWAENQVPGVAFRFALPVGDGPAPPVPPPELTP